MRRWLSVSIVVPISMLAFMLGGLAVAQAPGTSIDAEPEESTSVVTTGQTITATVLGAAGQPAEGEPVFWTEDGPGEIVAADNTTNADGEARAVVTSPEEGDQTVTAWLDPPAGTCDETTNRCDSVVVHWVAQPSPPGNALECSGGATALNTNLLGPFGHVPYTEEPCPPAGAEPVVTEDRLVGVPADPLINAQVLEARRVFTSDSALAGARAVGVTLGGQFEINVTRAFAFSSCDPRGIASQELSGGIVEIIDNNGTPNDPTDDSVIFEGEAPPNTTIDLQPLALIVLNQQDPEGGTVGPDLPDEPQARRAEGEVTAVHIELLASNIIADIANARSDVTCKQHAAAITLDLPDEITAPVGTEQPVTATVTDEAGRPVQGAQVTWTEEGQGEFVSQENTTDQNGQATAVVTSDAPGDQTVTASLDPATNKCGAIPTGVCSDSVIIHWQEDVIPPVDRVSFTGHAHTDYDGNNAVHRFKNDRGDVHIGSTLIDRDINDAQGPRGRLGYWDLRPDPPGVMKDEFRCEKFRVDTFELTSPNTVVITGTVGRCNKSQRDPSFATFRMEVTDNGPNPPNQDAYHVTFFDAAGSVAYDWADLTTVGLGDLTIDTTPAPPTP